MRKGWLVYERDALVVDTDNKNSSFLRLRFLRRKLSKETSSQKPK